MGKKVIISILIIIFLLAMGSNVFLLYESRRMQRKLTSLANNIIAVEKKQERLRKDFAQLRRKFRYPTELQARERLIDAWGAAALDTDIKSMRIAVESFPEDWETGILIVRYYDQEARPSKAIPKIDYFFMVKTLGGILYNTWGVANIYTFKNFTEVKSFFHVASDGSTESVEIWKNSKLWERTDIWNDVFWSSEDNFSEILKLQAKK